MINLRLPFSFGLPLWLATTMACASRTPPTSFPDDAPASPKAEAARPVTVTRALEGEPPLPGTARAKAWSGLSGPGEKSADPHGDHGHAHHHESHGAHAGDDEETRATAAGAGHEAHGGASATSGQQTKRDGGHDGAHDHHHHGAHE